MKDISVQLINIYKEFEETDSKELFAAVNDISLDIYQGEFFTLLGPSGCGKTTTLRLIAGFEVPTSGKIKIQGKDSSKIPPYQRPVHTVFQNYALFPHMSVEQNIAYGLKVKRVPKAEQKERVLEILDTVQLKKLGNRMPSQLSGGQQQRVALARALVNNPEVLLLDEPLGALDLKLRKEMQWELKRLQQLLGITFIYVTHDQEEALTMSDRIAVLSDGNLIQVGPPDEIYNYPNSKFVASFIGETNFLDIVLDRTEGFVGWCQIGGVTVRAEHPDDLPLYPGKAIFAIRPEKVTIRKKINPKEGTCSIPAKVTLRTFIGTDMRYVVELNDGKNLKLLTRLNGETENIHFEVGEEVLISFFEKDAFILTE